MEISLLVCTKDRAEKLVRCLESIQALDFDLAWELVVVDNASTDHTEQVVKQFQEKVDFPVRYLFENKVGVSAARNAGWKSCQGKIIANTDDDCYVKKDFLLCLWKLFQVESYGYVAGRILLFDEGDAQLTTQGRKRSRYMKPFGYIRPGLIQGANCAILKQALEDVAGYDERLGYGTPFACADIDVVARIGARGWKGLYHPSPIVHHHHERKKTEDVEEAIAKYDIGRGAYYIKSILTPKLTRRFFKGWRQGLYTQIKCRK